MLTKVRRQIARNLSYAQNGECLLVFERFTRKQQNLHDKYLNILKSVGNSIRWNL